VPCTVRCGSPVADGLEEIGAARRGARGRAAAASQGIKEEIFMA
jgi:hypothetical protein